MAAIGKIRSWGPVLVGVIGVALFAFIAGDLWKSCEATGNQQRMQVGEVLGEKISVQDFQALVDEYQDVIKLTQGRDNLTEAELNQVKDQVWDIFVNNKIIANEAEQLGLTVTDKEMQDILREGTNPMLTQSPFVNQQTGRFDVTMLTNFLNEYKKNQSNPQVAEQYQTIYKYWQFIEKTLRQQTLAQKFQSLLSHCLISNPVSAKASFADQQTESDILLASFAYSSVNDKDVEVSDADLTAKYNSQKEMYKQPIETRDIKFVDFQVLPSAADRAALMKTMTDAAQKLQSGAAAAEVVRKAQSQVQYFGLPVTSRAFASDIAAKIDSMSVGETTAPFETKSDNTLNVVKLIAKTQLPDSVEYRLIQVGGETLEATRTRADSIFNALKAGADFETLAKKYSQEGKKQWMTSAMYQNAPSIDTDTKAYITALNTLQTNELKNLELSQGNLVLQVTDRRAMTTKYDAAVIKHTIDFSKTTYSEAYNKFSQYVSENKTLEQLEQNAAKFGFQVQERPNVFNSDHYVANIRSTRDAMKWIFSAKAGDVSPLYECGNNDHLLVVALTKVHPVGYRDLDGVKDMVRQDVLRDKKFDLLKKKFEGVANIAAAKAKGAKVDSVNHVTFAAPAFIQATGASEPALSGAVAAVKQGEFSPRVVKGNAGAYMFQVLKKTEGTGKLDEKQQQQLLQQQALQAASRFMQELRLKAGEVDNRYMFF